MDKLNKMDEFLEIYNLSKLNQEEEDLNRPITTHETEAVIQKFPRNKSAGPKGLTGEFYQTFQELIPVLLKLFQKIRD